METSAQYSFEKLKASLGEISTEQCKRLLIAAFGLTVLVDFIFWPAPGGSAGCACLLLLASITILLSATQRSIALWIGIALSIATAWQAFNELKPSTVWVGLFLTVTNVGLAHFSAAVSLAERIIESVIAILFPLSPFVCLKALLRKVEISPDGPFRIGNIQRASLVILPAAAIALLYFAFFVSGNGVFRQISWNSLNTVFEWLLHLDITLPRVLFWMIVFLFVISPMRPVSSGIGSWIVSREVPRWRRRDGSLALWQSAAVLLAVNLLFFCVNTIDVVYLWSHTALPNDVNASEYLHEGVEGLILAVITSAALLTLMFYQEFATRSRTLKILASLWIVQNLVLIAGVYLRLQMYVADLQLTLLRIGVGLFLLLVVSGFISIALFIWQRRSLGWLIQVNAVATFVLFFCVQFVNLDGVIANFNVDRYLQRKNAHLDFTYLRLLDSSAWPAMIELAKSDRSLAAPARDHLWSKWQAETLNKPQSNWRTRERLAEQHQLQLNAFAIEQHWTFTKPE